MKRAIMILALALAPTLEATSADFCFGAVGQQCGSISMAGIQFAACAAVVPGMPAMICAVSRGSMTHDPCCADNPTGKKCGTEPENENVCRTEWDRAVHRFVWGYQWTRLVDSSVGNTSGDVVRADYCAKRGQGLHKNDEAYCCSRDARRGNFWERIGRPNLSICQ